MSGSTAAYRPAGPTQALSVVATSHAAVDVTFTTSDVATFIACLNTGTVAVAVKFSQQGVAASLPVDGTPGDWILPPLMVDAVCLPLPNGAQGVSPKVTAIGSAAGPSLVYVTPIVMQQ